MIIYINIIKYIKYEYTCISCMAYLCMTQSTKVLHFGQSLVSTIQQFPEEPAPNRKVVNRMIWRLLVVQELSLQCKAKKNTASTINYLAVKRIHISI